MRKPRRVLVVDDNEAVLDSVAMFVASVGHIPEKAPGGAEALEKLEQSDFDMVLTDLLMPGMSGDQLASEIEKCRPGLAVVLMTGKIPATRSPAVARTLQKPFSLTELRNLISELCDSGPALRERSPRLTD